MPYRDPEKKREWEKTHRAERSKKYLESVYFTRLYARQQWADPDNLTPEGGITSLRDLAVLPEEYAESRGQRLRRLKLL